MQAYERRQSIWKQISAQGGLSVSDLATQFGISKMTAHRDLVALEEQGRIRRIHGGAVAIQDATRTEILPTPPVTSEPQCAICRQTPMPHLRYSLTLDDGSCVQTCCAHCGLAAHLMHANRLQMALATDFFSGRPHPVQQSAILYGPDADICCQPAILTFADRHDAERFARGFGGDILDLNQALARLEAEMSMSPGACPNCHS